jgi:hypothetical protein
LEIFLIFNQNIWTCKKCPLLLLRIKKEMTKTPFNSLSIEDLLFGNGCLLDGIFDAQKKLEELRKKPYSVGRREPGSHDDFSPILNEITDYQLFIKSLLDRKLSSFNDSDTVANFLLNGMRDLVRGARLLDVLKLKYHYTSSKSKVNDEVYEMLRIYFTSDSGKRVRSVSKNMGNIRNKNQVIGTKILSMLGYTHIEENKSLRNRFDFTARLGYEIFEIDVRNINRVSLIETYTFIYLWQYYKKVK